MALPETVVLGDFEVSRVNDSVYWWDGGAMFGVVPKTLWSRKVQVDDLNRVPLAFNCYLIRTGEHSIVIETGIGDKRDARARERMKVPPATESLPAVLAGRGIDPESIDIVINSHLHWDHCSGNTIVKGDRILPAFPRARYFTARGEWEHAHERHVRDAISYIDANYDPLVESGRMILVDGDHEVVPGIWMRRAPGHNRDMMVVTAESRGQTFCFLSDLVPMTAHLPPTWVMAFDLYPLETIANKEIWLRRAVEGNWVCGFAHETERPFARIAADDKAQFAVAAESERIVHVETAAQLAQVRELFEEYWKSFGFTPCFQGFAGEVAGLPGDYARPGGGLALATVDGHPVGCAALRRLDDHRCEAKRLYVRPQYRGRGLGRRLMDWIIAEARASGYREMVGDTMPVMTTALSMYDRSGFERTAPYSDHPTEGAVYLRFNL